LHVLRCTDETTLSDLCRNSQTNTATGGRASKVSILVKGGTYEASPYKITLKAVTNNVIPHKWELDVFMRVKEI